MNLRVLELRTEMMARTRLKLNHLPPLPLVMSARVVDYQAWELLSAPARSGGGGELNETQVRGGGPGMKAWIPTGRCAGAARMTPFLLIASPSQIGKGPLYRITQSLLK